MKYIILLFVILSGCATKQPMPVPAKMPNNFCKPGETENCRPWTPSELNGGSSYGHN